MIELLALVVVIYAGLSVRKLVHRVSEIESRLKIGEALTQRLEDDLARLRAGGRRPDVPPASPAASVPPATPKPDAPKPAEPATSVPVTPGAEKSTTAPGRWTSVPPVPPVTPPPATSAPSAPPPPRASLEERLGTRWAVWIGGLALALGGLLLVRYSIEQGIFGPGARIVMGLLFSAALIGAGEWFRRGERSLAIEVIPAAHIPGILTAAGTASAFGTIYAAHALYGFVAPGATFVLLGALGIATMLAAALHGPALAGLGLAGAYVAPLLVSSARPSPWPVVVYLAVVAATAMGLARIRHWLWLAALAVAGAFMWGAPFVQRIDAGLTEWTLAGYLHALIQLALAAGFIAVEPALAVRDRDARPDPVAAGALGALTLLVIAMISVGRFDLGSAVPFALAAAAILAGAAWLGATAAVGAVLAGLVVLSGIAGWPGLAAPPDKTLLAPAMAGVLRLPENVSSFLTFSMLASLALMGVAGLRLLRGRELPVYTGALYALAATVTPLLALVLAYLRVTQFDKSISFALAGAVLAATFAVAADRFQKSESPEHPTTGLATGAFAAAAIAGVSFAMVAHMERGYLTIALALTALGTAFIAVRRDIPLLRHVVTALALVVLARLAWEPRIMGDGVGRWPLVNWLLAGYGIPAAAFWGAARILDTKGETISARIADAVAILLAGLLCFFEIHHALNHGDALAPTTGHVEQGLLAIVSLGFSYALMRLDLGRANPVFHYASLAFAVLSALLILFGLGIAENPLLTGEPVGGPKVLSTLAVAYLLPGLAAMMLARASRPHRPAWLVTGLAVLAALLLFGYVTLEVRHAFQGAGIGWLRRTGSAEQWTYSAVWLLLGLVFLAYGIWRSSLEARLASAALVLLSVAKVFLLDLGGLTGVWRALSFIVLGLVLIGIGLAYQNLVFARPRPAPPAPAPRPE